MTQQLFYPGDLVEVRPAVEILQTLDADGTLDGLPFMPEMLAFCGRTFRLWRRLEKTCVEGSRGGFREFINNDVVTLDGTRCSGGAHGGCGRQCTLFWKEAWLREPADIPPSEAAPTEDGPVIAGRVDNPPSVADRLTTRRPSGDYVCQSSELERATLPLPRLRRLWKSVRDVQHGNYSLGEMIRLVVVPALGKLSLPFTSRHPGTCVGKTPVESLGLKPGDWIEVKSVDEIRATLDSVGCNRGLRFSNDLAHHCGKRYLVRGRLDHMILEGSGKMVDVRNTVILDGVGCPCRYVIGGCPRADLIYWREIWLRKVPRSGMTR